MAAMASAETYAASGVNEVAGWLAPESAAMILALGRCQTARGLIAGIGEIGIHHGKLFILLDLLRIVDEGAVAIDIFERQDLNRDASGRGDKDIFLGHRRRFGCSDERLTLIDRDSTAVAPRDILDVAGPLRLFSIDGGHTADVLGSDLRLAEAVMADGGIVIVDDVYNELWPEVAWGTFRHLDSPDTQLRPFAVSPNKLYLARGDAADYRDLLRREFASCFWSTATLCGSEVVVFSRRSWKSRLKNSPLYHRPLMQQAIRTAKRLLNR